jgi:hypothetical protein
LIRSRKADPEGLRLRLFRRRRMLVVWRRKGEIISSLLAFPMRSIEAGLCLCLSGGRGGCVGGGGGG